MSSSVQFMSELFLHGCSHTSQFFRTLAPIIVPALNINYVTSTGFVSTEYVPKKGIGQNARKESLKRKVSQIYGKGEVVKRKVMLQPYHASPRLYMSSTIVEIRGVTSMIYHFLALSPCIVDPYCDIWIVLTRGFACFLQHTRNKRKILAGK